MVEFVKRYGAVQHGRPPLELARQTDVTCDTVWTIKQKLIEGRLQRNAICKLDGDVQIDKPGHTPCFLATYEWRQNRCFDLPANLSRLADVAVTIEPERYRDITAVRLRSAAQSSE